MRAYTSFFRKNKIDPEIEVAYLAVLIHQEPGHQSELETKKKTVVLR